MNDNLYERVEQARARNENEEAAKLTRPLYKAATWSGELPSSHPKEKLAMAYVHALHADLLIKRRNDVEEARKEIVRALEYCPNYADAIAILVDMEYSRVFGAGARNKTQKTRLMELHRREPELFDKLQHLPELQGVSVPHLSAYRVQLLSQGLLHLRCEYESKYQWAEAIRVTNAILNIFADFALRDGAPPSSDTKDDTPSQFDVPANLQLCADALDRIPSSHSCVLPPVMEALIELPGLYRKSGRTQHCITAYRVCLGQAMRKYLLPLQRKRLLAGIGRVLNRCVSPAGYPTWPVTVPNAPLAAQEESDLALSLAIVVPAAVQDKQRAVAIHAQARDDLVLLHSRLDRFDATSRVLERTVLDSPNDDFAWARLAMSLSKCASCKRNALAIVRAVEEALRIRRTADAAPEGAFVSEAVRLQRRLIPNHVLLLLASRAAGRQLMDHEQAVNYARMAVESTTDKTLARANCLEALGVAYETWARTVPTEASRLKLRHAAADSLQAALDLNGFRELTSLPSVRGRTADDRSRSLDLEEKVHERRISDPSVSQAAGAVSAVDAEVGAAKTTTPVLGPSVPDPTIVIEPPSSPVVSRERTLSFNQDSLSVLGNIWTRDAPALPVWRVAYNAAVVYAALHQVDRASSIVAAALTDNPDKAELWMLASNFLSGRRDVPQALDVVRAALKVYPGHYRLLLLEALLLELVDKAACLRAFEAMATMLAEQDSSGSVEGVLETNPDRLFHLDYQHSEWFSDVVDERAAAAKDRVPHLLEPLADSRIAAPTSDSLNFTFQFWLHFGRLCLSTGQPEHALQCYANADALADVINTPTARASVIERIGMVHEMAGDGNAAEAQYCAALAVNPEYWPSFVRLAALAMRRISADADVDPEHPIPTVRGAAAGPAIPIPASTAAAAAPSDDDDGEMSGVFGDSERRRPKAKPAPPTVPVMPAEQLDRAEAFVTAALRANSKSHHAWRVMGSVFAAQGDHEQASDALFTALEVESVAPVLSMEYVPLLPVCGR